MDRKRTELTAKPRRKRIGILMLALLSLPNVVMAQGQDKPRESAQNSADPDKPKDETLDKAGKIVAQPVHDVGIAKTRIAPILQEAVKQPYAMPGKGSCASITSALRGLNAELGPDFGTNTKTNESKAEKLALAGGEALVNTLIPFRGLVREISGAGPADRRKAAAISAGIARRGYLRGLAVSRKCRLP